MHPFLLITTRPEDEVVRLEHDAFRRFTGLAESDLQWVRLDQQELPEISADAFSGIILGGSPYNSSDHPDEKSAAQRRAEFALSGMLDRVIEQDIPFFGACYGVGTLGLHQGGVVDRQHGELVGIVPITMTEEGEADPLLQASGLPRTFHGIVGHKEAISRLPEHATLLATGQNAPVQMFRIGTRQYATQFHPELDVPGLIDRLSAYRDHGYTSPGTFDATVERLRSGRIDHTDRLLRAFVTLFAR